MIKLLCEDNNLEYTGGGYLQCGRHVNCPKKQNNKILGFDCLVYVDNLPENCKINSPLDSKNMGVTQTPSAAKILVN